MIKRTNQWLCLLSLSRVLCPYCQCYLIMCVIAIDYVCPFIDYMHFICTLFLGSSKGAFKIKCVIIT